MHAYCVFFAAIVVVAVDIAVRCGQHARKCFSCVLSKRYKKDTIAITYKAEENTHFHFSSFSFVFKEQEK